MNYRMAVSKSVGDDLSGIHDGSSGGLHGDQRSQDHPYLRKPRRRFAVATRLLTASVNCSAETAGARGGCIVDDPFGNDLEVAAISATGQSFRCSTDLDQDLVRVTANLGTLLKSGGRLSKVPNTWWSTAVSSVLDR